MISAAEFAAYNRAVAKIGDRAASDVEAAVLAWCRAHEGATVAEKREAADGPCLSGCDRAAFGNAE